MEETSIVLVSRFYSPPRREKRIKYVSRHAPRRTQVNSLSGVVQEEVPVVKDYPDVFPEELPRMPPDRDIEFLDRAIARHRTNIEETVSDARK